MLDMYIASILLYRCGCQWGT